MKKGLLKFISVTAVAVMCTSALAGCGNTNTAKKTDSEKAPASDKKETLVMGTNAEFQPFEFVVSGSEGLVGEFDGIDVAIAKNIADKDGKELKIENMQFDGLIAALSSGKVDFVAAGMTATEERKKNVDFSDTYYVASQVIVTGADNTDITKAEDLKNGKTVGVVLGYTGDSVVTEDLAVPEDKITRANRGIDLVQDVKNGKLDAVVIDSATGKALAEKNGLKVVEDAEAFETEEYAIAVKKGNTELLDKINKTLSEMKANGEIDKLAEKYN